VARGGKKTAGARKDRVASMQVCACAKRVQKAISGLALCFPEDDCRSLALERPDWQLPSTECVSRQPLLPVFHPAVCALLAQVMPEAALSPSRRSTGPATPGEGRRSSGGKRAAATKATVVQVAPAPPTEGDRVMRAVRSVHQMVAAKFGGWGQHDSQSTKQEFL
jgi:hypothetical protein